MSEEAWRAIPGYEGFYEVSDHGRVRRIAAHPRGRPDIAGRLVKVTRDARGYGHVSLSMLGKVRSFRLSHLVAAAFIGPRPPGHEINHKDGDASNDVPGNMEWTTHQENIQHKYRVLGHKMPSGEAHHMTKASSEDVAEARKLLASGMPKKEVAARFGHHLSWAYRIASGQTRTDG